MVVERSSSSTTRRTILESKVGTIHNGEEPQHRLRLVMLGCEEKPPYGPSEHTAALFLDLICKSLEEIVHSNASDDDCCCCWIVSIAIYRVQLMDYPSTAQEWDDYDGILLPGSFSAAYDNQEWIEKLKQVIVNELYGNARPTLGICFGHQVFAHAFDDGEAVKCSAGAQVGRKYFPLTKEGSDLMLAFKESKVNLYYTHCDMVQKLPSCAVSLGGSETAPILAAAYYRTSDDEKVTPSSSLSDVRPIAITFQAHPEYASSTELGLHTTFASCLCAMQERGDFSKEEEDVIRQDAIDYYAQVERDSINVMKTVGIRLGWFPQQE